MLIVRLEWIVDVQVFDPGSIDFNLIDNLVLLCFFCFGYDVSLSLLLGFNFFFVFALLVLLFLFFLIVYFGSSLCFFISFLSFSIFFSLGVLLCLGLWHNYFLVHLEKLRLRQLPLELVIEEVLLSSVNEAIFSHQRILDILELLSDEDLSVENFLSLKL